MPRQMGHVLALGGFPNSVEHEQNIFVFVFIWTWTSSPITVSYFIVRIQYWRTCVFDVILILITHKGVRQALSSMCGKASINREYGPGYKGRLIAR